MTPQVSDILSRISAPETKLGELRKIAKVIKRDHELAVELWSTGLINAQLLAILIMDKKQLTQEIINQLDQDIQKHDPETRNRLADWLMANQLSKHKNTITLMESWENSPSPIQRRLFWYYQARLRWTGQTPPANTKYLLSSIEARLEKEAPEVQWAMNFTAAQIGIHQPEFRATCIELGKKTGLYHDEVVPKGCTPNYLPEFIRIEVAKLSKQ